MSVGLCRASSHAGCYVICVTHIIADAPPWYLLEFSGPTCEWGKNEPYDESFDLEEELEERLIALDVDWFPVDKIEPAIREHFPAVTYKPGWLEALTNWWWDRP